MVIKLYKTLSDPKAVNKALTDELNVSGIAREPVDIVNPNIEIDYDNTTLAGYNYAYIEDYARWYFVEPQNDSYNLNMLRLHCDVLTTAAAWLRARNATITRNERLYNAYLNDPEFKSYAYTNIVTRKFPTPISGDSIILMTVG